MQEQKKAAHLQKTDGAERELRGLVLQLSHEVERRLNFNAFCFGVIIGILVIILVK